MANIFRSSSHISSFSSSALGPWAASTPWELTAASLQIVRSLLAHVSSRDYIVSDEVAVHRTAVVESGSTIKGPVMVGAGCFVASGAYLRGGNWIAENCSIGPGCELKSSFLFPGTRLAHFNYVGDSVIGADVNMEAGSIICNYRNERADKEIWVRSPFGLERTGSCKFGALVGDNSRIGANAVLAPGAILPRGTVIGRAMLLDQETSG